MSTARIANARPLAPKAPFSASRPARAVRVVAAAQENQGPKDVALKTLGALAAVQFALLPVAGTAIADIIPNQAERAEINKKTSDLPTFGEVGDALKKNLGQNDPKDIGKAIDRNTPDLDLTKNPKDIGKDIKRGIQKNTPDLPDLSELPNLTKQPNFFKGEGEVNATNEVKNKVKDAGSDIGKGLPNLPSLPNFSGNPVEKAADKAQAAGSKVADKAKNVASDLSELPNLTKQPNFFKGEGEVNATNEVKNKVKDAGSDIGKGLPNLPSLPNFSGNPVEKAADKAQAAGSKVADKAKNVASDLSELPNLTKQPNFFKGEGEVNATNEVKNKVKSAGSDIGKGLPSLPNLSGNPAQKAADKAQGVANKAKNAVSDLSDLPNPFKGSSSPQGLANDAKNKAQSLKNEVGKNIPNAGDAKRAVDKNTPNLPKLGGGLPGTNQGKGGLNIPRNS
ncbi:hypothetical protein WJX75_007908 [Coccomyxa subellipsoidea]|uniref:Uncharacterized protein n=1 Tax=Coccomyxa subellipsoidea TaxID=248742 RepID=A0ABR2YIG4_9CHLO